MVDVVMGSTDGLELWANELLLWASTQRVIVENATGKIVRQDSISPRTQPWLDDFARLRTEMAIAERFGDLSAAKDGLSRVLDLLGDLPNLMRRRRSDWLAFPRRGLDSLAELTEPAQP